MPSSFPSQVKTESFSQFRLCFFLTSAIFFLVRCDVVAFSFLNPCAPAYQAVYFFSVLLMVLILNHYQNISLSYFLRRSNDLAFCCLVLISTFLFLRFLRLSKMKVMQLFVYCRVNKSNAYFNGIFFSGVDKSFNSVLQSQFLVVLICNKCVSLGSVLCIK